MSASTIIAADQPDSAPAAAAAYPFTRLIGWSVRRELWENRSIWIAPFAAAGLLIVTVLIVAVRAGIDAPSIGARIDASGGGEFNHMGGMPQQFLWIPYVLIAAPVFAASLVVAAAYCLGALHGERRDRSILFWKSLPVSDRVTVLSKAAIPLVVTPLVSLAAAIVAQLAILALMLIFVPLFGARAHIVWNGVPVDASSARMIWDGVPIFYLTLCMFYGLLTTALWQAPVYAWLLLVGGWARRMAFVWAIAPVAALMLAERIVFGTYFLTTMLAQRANGNLVLAFADLTNGSLPAMTPGRFLADPGLWTGLAVAALFLGAAIMLRRYRQPV